MRSELPHLGGISDNPHLWFINLMTVLLLLLPLLLLLLPPLLLLLLIVVNIVISITIIITSERLPLAVAELLQHAADLAGIVRMLNCM